MVEYTHTSLASSEKMVRFCAFRSSGRKYFSNQLISILIILTTIQAFSSSNSIWFFPWEILISWSIYCIACWRWPTVLKYCNLTLCSFLAACSDFYNGKHLLQTTIIVISWLTAYGVYFLSSQRTLSCCPLPSCPGCSPCRGCHRTQCYDRSPVWFFNFRISLWRHYEQIQWENMKMAVLM